MIMIVKLATKEIFGPRLRYLRKRAKIHQEDLAAHLGVKGATVSRWEKSLMLPTEDKIEEICKYFKKSYEFFTADELDDLSSQKQLKIAKNKGKLSIEIETEGRSDAFLRFIEGFARMIDNGTSMDEKMSISDEIREEISDFAPDELHLVMQTIEAIRQNTNRSTAIPKKNKNHQR